MAKVTLDRDTFKALASETRLDVMRALDERRKTGSELARELDLNKATVHEHLQILEATELARRFDEGRKWVYWELTWSGKKLLHPEQGTSFSVLLGLSALATGGGLVALGRALGWWLADAMDAGPTVQNRGEPEAVGDASADDGAESADSSGTEMAEAPMAGGDMASDEASSGIDFFEDGGWVALALLLTAVVALALATWLRKKA